MISYCLLFNVIFVAVKSCPGFWFGFLPLTHILHIFFSMQLTSGLNLANSRCVFLTSP